MCAARHLDHPCGDDFVARVTASKAAYWKKREGNGIFGVDGPRVYDSEVESVQRYTYWYEEGSALRVIRLYDIPETLSGDILRLKAQVPEGLTGEWEIDGDICRPLLQPPALPGDFENWDAEFIALNAADIAKCLASLPLVDNATDEAYFLKKPKYSSEIQNLLKCQGGSCPGIPSAHVIQLLGKSVDGELVFPRMKTKYSVIGTVHAVKHYVRWFKDLIEGIKELHSKDIVHRDLRADNVLWSYDLQRLVIGDVEGRWETDTPQRSRIMVLWRSVGQRPAIYGTWASASKTSYSEIPQSPMPLRGKSHHPLLPL